MKLILTIMVFAIGSIVNFNFAQTNIETPYGFPNLSVNMTTEALIAEMGQPERVNSFESEKKIWVDGGFDISKSIAFLIGFDSVLLYDYQNKYCLWKAYVKDNEIIYMNLVSRFVQDQYKTKVTVRNQIHFEDSIEKIESVLGTNFFPDRGFGYTDYLYHDLGIRFTFHQNKMTNIYLFRRLDNMADLYVIARHFPKDKE